MKLTKPLAVAAISCAAILTTQSGPASPSSTLGPGLLEFSVVALDHPVRTSL